MATVSTAQGAGGSYSYVGNPDFRGYVSGLIQSNPAALGNNANLLEAGLGSGGSTGFINNNGTVNNNALQQYAAMHVMGDAGKSGQLTGQAEQNAINNIVSGGQSTISGLYNTYNGLANGSGSGGGGSGSTSGSGGLYPNINVPAYNQAVIDKLNATLAGANTTYNQAQSFLPTQEADAQREAGAAINNAQTTANSRISADQQNISNTNAERQLALQQLADQIHGQYQGLLSQLGAVGAGNSSAAVMGAQALGHEQAINSANTNMNADTQNAAQQTDITTTGKNRDAYVAQQQDALKSTLDNIQSQFGQLLNQLKTQIGEATPEAQQQLAYFGGVLSKAAQLASAQAVQQFSASLAPVEANMAATGTQNANDLATAQNNVAQYMQTNPANGVNIGAFSLGSATTPTPILTSNISPFATASPTNAAGQVNPGAPFNSQNSQTSGPGNDVISYLNSLLSSAPGQASQTTNGG